MHEDLLSDQFFTRFSCTAQAQKKLFNTKIRFSRGSNQST